MRSKMDCAGIPKGQLPDQNSRCWVTLWPIAKVHHPPSIGGVFNGLSFPLSCFASSPKCPKAWIDSLISRSVQSMCSMMSMHLPGLALQKKRCCCCFDPFSPSPITQHTCTSQITLFTPPPSSPSNSTSPATHPTCPHSTRNPSTLPPTPKYTRLAATSAFPSFTRFSSAAMAEVKARSDAGEYIVSDARRSVFRVGMDGIRDSRVDDGCHEPLSRVGVRPMD